MIFETKHNIGDKFWYYTHDDKTRTVIIKAIVTNVESVVKKENGIEERITN